MFVLLLASALLIKGSPRPLEKFCLQGCISNYLKIWNSSMFNFTWKWRGKIKILGRKNQLNFKIWLLFMKTKFSAVLEIGTSVSVDCSFTHCASETDTKIWRYKLFYIGLKSLCCDVLSQKEKVIGCQGSLTCIWF